MILLFFFKYLEFFLRITPQNASQRGGFSVEQPADHLRWDLACALLVKLMPGGELELTIGARQRSLETGMKEIAGVDHDYASGAAINLGSVSR